MSTTTTNYNLVKPALGDAADITTMNENWDKLDTKLKSVENTQISHGANTSNPHKVTKSQVGLGNVDNTSDANKPISAATQAALDKKLDGTTLSSGRALVSDSSGKVAVSTTTSTELGYVSGVTSKIQTQLNNKISSNGGDVGGPLIFNDQSAFAAVTKERTINNAKYLATFGCGQYAGKGCVAMELSTGGNVVSRLEIRPGAVAYVDANNVRHTIVTWAVSATVES